MTAKIIPFRIKVNPVSHKESAPRPNQNADMQRDKSPQEIQLEKLVRQHCPDCIHKPGTKWADTINENSLAEWVNKRIGKTLQGGVKQSLVHKIRNGSIKKPESMEPIAQAFGMNSVEFFALMNPDLARPTSGKVPPPAAAELWAEFSRLPPKLQDYFREQIRSAIAWSEQFPDLSSALNMQAFHASQRIRQERRRSKKAQ